MLVLLAALVFATSAFACTTIIVGKAASKTGSCLVAHNEDDAVCDCPIVKAVPAASHDPGSVYKLFYGGTVPLPAQTEGFIATAVYDKSLIPGDVTGLINDHQVTIFNNWAPGRCEPKGSDLMLWSEFTELAGLQATTAREAVEIIGHLVETHGAKWGGTMFGVADPNEGWWVEVCGRQWVARRVSDGGAEVRANCYRIGVVDFAQPDKYMWSPDVVTFARARGWYRPADGPFNWKKAYGWRGSTRSPDNTVRQKMAARYLAADLAHGLITRQQLMKILRSHFEGSRYFNLKCDPYTICNNWNISSSVAELRGSLPAGIGGVLWTTLSVPSCNGFVPWYEGVTQVPVEYATGAYRYMPGSAYWACRRLAKWVDHHYRGRHGAVASAWRAFEQGETDQQAALEAAALEKYATDAAQAWEYLTAYSGGQAHEVYLLAQQLRR
jgi:dipeptidase